MVLPNNSWYLGSTKNLNKRKYTHLYDLKNNKHSCKLLQKWFNKGGNWKDINWEILDIDKKINILEKENNFIELNNPKCLNNQKPWALTYQKLLKKEGYKIAHKTIIKDYYKNYYKTPKGKLQQLVDSAKSNIKKYTKLNKLDLVKKWETKLVERLENKNKFITL